MSQGFNLVLLFSNLFKTSWWWNSFLFSPLIYLFFLANRVFVGKHIHILYKICPRGICVLFIYAVFSKNRLTSQTNNFSSPCQNFLSSLVHNLCYKISLSHFCMATKKSSWLVCGWCYFMFEPLTSFRLIIPPTQPLMQTCFSFCLWRPFVFITQCLSLISYDSI